jgi:ABC-type transport system substrate-binding protein
MKTGLGRWLFLAIAGIAVIGGVTHFYSSGGDKGGAGAKSVLVIGAEGAIPPLDPHRLTGTVGLRIVDAIFDPLVRDDMRRETKQAPALTPGLAQSWTASPDGKAFSFQLRQNVVFHDGTAFDAAAVKANFDRLLDKASPYFDDCS